MIAGVFWTGHFLYSIKWNVLCVKRCVKRGRTLVSPLHVTRLGSVAQPRRISRKKNRRFHQLMSKLVELSFATVRSDFPNDDIAQSRGKHFSKPISLIHARFLYVNFTWQESLNSSSPSQTSLVCEIGFYVLFLWIYKVVRRPTVICRV